MRSYVQIRSVVALALLGALAACGGETSSATESATSTAAAAVTGAGAAAEPVEGKAADGAVAAEGTEAGDALAEGEAPAAEAAPAAPDPNWAIGSYADPHAVITMIGGGVVAIDLESDKAPKTAENFIRLAEQKFYDGTVFHRVIPGFMAQGGSPEGQGRGGPGWNIDLEIHRELRHVRGSVAMARKQDPNSAGSQFYICYEAKSFLDDQYAVFGKVVSGMDVVDGFKYGSTNSSEMRRQGWSGPEEGYPSVIETVRIVDGPPAD